MGVSVCVGGREARGGLTIAFSPTMRQYAHPICAASMCGACAQGLSRDQGQRVLACGTCHCRMPRPLLCLHRLASVIPHPHPPPVRAPPPPPPPPQADLGFQCYTPQHNALLAFTYIFGVGFGVLGIPLFFTLILRKACVQ